MWSRQRYIGLLGCLGLNQKLYTSLHVQVHVGQGPPAEAPAAALPAGINCQTSPDGTQVLHEWLQVQIEQWSLSRSCMQSHHLQSFVALKKLPCVRSKLPRQEAPIMIAENRNCFLFLVVNCAVGLNAVCMTVCSP